MIVISAEIDHFPFLKVGGEGSCFGDSGGPLVIYDTFVEAPHYVQVGVVRGTSGECGDRNFPDIYARLEDFEVLNWLYSLAFGQRLQVQPEKAVTPSTVIPPGNAKCKAFQNTYYSHLQNYYS